MVGIQLLVKHEVEYILAKEHFYVWDILDRNEQTRFDVFSTDTQCLNLKWQFSFVIHWNRLWVWWRFFLAVDSQRPLSLVVVLQNIEAWRRYGVGDNSSSDRNLQKYIIKPEKTCILYGKVWYNNGQRDKYDKCVDILTEHSMKFLRCIVLFYLKTSTLDLINT